ncbi:MAG: aminoacyl-tRNA hydrolase [Saprospiraceae bacterium]
MNWLQRFFNLFNDTKAELEDPMKFLIVGLGNMGAEYDQTRHNIGFEVLDQLAADAGVSFKNDTLGDLAEFKHKGRTIILLKPSTFMNRSGKALRYWMQKKKIQNDNFLIVVDDLNLPFGSLRLRAKGSDGGHNGLKDINQVLGHNKYPRIRFGIGDSFSKGRQVDFVLGKWSTEEMEKLSPLLKEAGEMIKSFATIGVTFTMNQFNKKK